MLLFNRPSRTSGRVAVRSDYGQRNPALLTGPALSQLAVFRPKGLSSNAKGNFDVILAAAVRCCRPASALMGRDGPMSGLRCNLMTDVASYVRFERASCPNCRQHGSVPGERACNRPKQVATSDAFNSRSCFFARIRSPGRPAQATE
jgi:hypothetical protein